MMVLAVRIVDVTDRERKTQFAPGSGIFLASDHTGVEEMKFRFPHGAFQSNKETVIKIGHIVDTVLINQKAPNSPQSSRSFIRSADDRARREISTPSTAPTSPKDKFVMSWAKLDLLERPDSDIPRSTSITGMCYSGQPSDNAFS